MLVRLNGLNGEKMFSSKAVCSDHFSRMLHSYDPPSTVSTADAYMLAALLKHHPRCEAKIGPGILHFEVRLGEHGAPSFHIISLDHVTVKFSYKKAVRGYQP